MKQNSKPFRPHSVTCYVQDGGNLPPPPVSSNPTAGGNLLYNITIKKNSIKYLNAFSYVIAVIELYGDKYTYHLPLDAYYRIRRIDDDCRRRYGYPISVKVHLGLCKRHCYDSCNERYNAL